MIAIRSQLDASTDRSWLMISMPIDRSRAIPLSRSRICACTMTSSAVVGSSHSSTFGSQVSASAIMMRCFCPPDSWCG